MITKEIALKYSRALFRIKHSQNEIEKMLVDLEFILAALNVRPGIMDFFSSPKISKKEKQQVLEKSFAEQIDPQILKFILFLVEKKRIVFFPAIVADFKQQLIERSGILQVLLITATQVDQDTRELLKKKLESAYEKKIEINEELDPKLIAGGILIFSNKLIDFSVKGKLDRLKKDLLSLNV